MHKSTTETTETGRKILTLKLGGTPSLRLPERNGVIIPPKGKASIGRVVQVTHKKRLKPRTTEQDDDVFSGFSGGSQRHIRRPKK